MSQPVAIPDQVYLGTEHDTQNATINRRVRRILFSFIYIATMGYAVVLGFVQPYKNWDMLGYVGSVMQWGTSDPEKLYAQTMKVVGENSSAPLFRSYQENPLSRRADAFNQELPIYQVKPFYNALVWTVSHVVSLPAATWVVSATSFALLAALLFAWYPLLHECTASLCRSVEIAVHHDVSCMLRLNRLKLFKAFLVVLACAGTLCLPFLIDVENRNVELGKADRTRKTRPALRNSVVIRTPFRTADPYVEYVNQLRPVLTSRSDWSLLRIYAGQYALTAQETSAMEEAIGRWRSLLDLMPLDDGAWENISRLYLFTGRKADALSAAGRAVMIRPGDYSHLVNLGLANELLGIKNDALSSYARALAIHPRLLYSPFWLELTQRDQVFAREVLSVSVQNEEDVYKKTGDVIESERLARLLMASGDRTRASQIVNAILSASPELEGAWELNAELTEDSNAATLHYRRASFLDPSDPLPHARLGDLEIASHDISAAATEWFTAWTLHKALRTPHSEIAKVRYRLPVCISNDAIPNNWIYYISPAFAFSSAFSTIAQAYETSGQIKEATMYRNLARVSRPQLKGAYDEER